MTPPVLSVPPVGQRARGWWSSTRVALKTLVVLLAALQLLQLLGVTRVELARADTTPRGRLPGL